MVHPVTLVDGSALKSAAICGRVAHLPRLMILVSGRWLRSGMIFFLPQRCRRFDILSDSRYAREMVVRENTNSITTSDMLCPISRVPTVAPSSNSLKF
ncbi:uncharacterized protein TNCV_584761 [Trichonephila clavipes]|nr:uncharacterized protein TNCV_584761 [Trichonephila clavipes]